MSSEEIAKAFTEAVLAKVDLTFLKGQDVKDGDAEALGKKVGKLYKGILAEVRESKESRGGTTKVQRY